MHTRTANSLRKAIVVAGILATLQTTTMAALGSSGKTIIVWDGEKFAIGGGWVNPTTSTIKPQSKVAHGGKAALELKFKDNAHWIGAGWNWLQFKTGSFGTDITGMTHFTFWIKAKGVTGDLQFNLLCNGPVLDTPEHHTDKVRVAKYCPKAFDGKWHQVVVPLADLKQPSGFDAKHVCELQMGFIADKQVDGSFFIDDIAFLNRK
jgi:hypothetical protein